MGRPEKAVRERIIRALGGQPDLLILSNPTGRAEYVQTAVKGDLIGGSPDIDAKDRFVDYGLGGRGGCDLIGFLHWVHPDPRPGLSDLRGAQTLGIEVKAPGKHRSQHQIRWHLQAAARGVWILEEATSAEQALSWLEECRGRLRSAGLHPAPADPGVLRALRAVVSPSR